MNQIELLKFYFSSFKIVLGSFRLFLELNQNNDYVITSVSQICLVSLVKDPCKYFAVFDCFWNFSSIKIVSEVFDCFLKLKLC